jgi:hypothetical protein
MYWSMGLPWHSQTLPQPGKGGGGGLPTEGGEGFSGPKDKPDTDGQQNLTLPYTGYGFHELKFLTGCDE